METAEQIASNLMSWTCDHSGHESRRDYIGLSHCSSQIELILESWKDGFSADSIALLKCYKGYQMEADLLRRLRAVYGDRVKPGGEITAFGGLVKGHPDFRFDDFPGDMKTVPLDEHLPAIERLPRRVFWQLQGYMLYSGKTKVLCIYESRESGLIAAYWVYPVRCIQDEIHEKMTSVVSQVKKTNQD